MLKDGKWVEQQGETVYDMSGYSDEELIKELESRGYPITQLLNTASVM